MEPSEPVRAIPEGVTLKAGDGGGEGGAPPALFLLPSPRSTVFVGPNGIRAGWRLLLFLAILAGILAVFLAPLAPVARHGVLAGFAPFAQLWGEFAAFFATLLAALAMGRIEKRSLADFGLPVRRAFGADFWRGVGWGFVALTALLALLRVNHNFFFGSLALRGTGLASYGAGWAVAFLFVGFCEEFLFRGYALFTLSTGMGFWPSAVLLSVVFGAVHLRNPGEAWIGGLAAGLIGLFFCLTLRRTGSLWFAIGLHAMWDYAESFIYSVPDSGVLVPGHLLNSSFHGSKWLTGGSVGPEGSVLVFVVVGLMFFIFDLAYREVRFPRVAVSSQLSALEGPPAVVEA